MLASRQKGVTLISLMIWMVISLFAILACLSLFQDLIQVSAEAKADASQEGHLATALLRIQTELQNTSYGMGRDPTLPSPVADFVINATGTAITWRYRDDTPATPVLVCQHISQTASGATTPYTLTLHKILGGVCTATVDLATLNWIMPPAPPSEVLAQVNFYNANGVATTGKTLLTFVNTGNQICAPYGWGVSSTASSSSSSGAASSSSGATIARDKHPIIAISKTGVVAVSNSSSSSSSGSSSGSALGNETFRVCLPNVATL